MRGHRVLPLPINQRGILIIAAIVSMILVVIGWSRQSYAQGITDTLSQPDIIRFLNQTIAWYQQQNLQRQTAVSASDILFANDNRPLASQIARLSFDFA